MSGEAKHTPEPWRVVGEEYGTDRIVSLAPDLPVVNDGYGASCVVSSSEWTHLSDANAARIVACVNACAGMADPAAPAMNFAETYNQLVAVEKTNSELAAVRNELIAALRAVEEHHVELNQRAGRPEQRSFTLRTVRAAIAKAQP